jgi:hypothetical protein
MAPSPIFPYLGLKLAILIIKSQVYLGGTVPLRVYQYFSWKDIGCQTKTKIYFPTDDPAMKKNVNIWSTF